MLNVIRILLLSFLLFVGANQFASAATFLWSAGMEGGNLNEWALNSCGGKYNSGLADSVASQEYAQTGTWGVKMTISTPSSPTSGTRPFRWCEPQTHAQLYYSVWYYFPQKYSVPDWWNVFQWKSKVSSTKNDPFFILTVSNRNDGTMFFHLYDWQKKVSSNQSVKDIPVGRWFQVEAFYQCAADNTGRVTFWQDGTLLFDVQNVQTRYADGDCQWSVNNYSDSLSPTPTTIYIDNASISVTRIGSLAAPTQLLGLVTSE